MKGLFTYNLVFLLAMAPAVESSTLLLKTSFAPAATAKSAERVLLTIWKMKRKLKIDEVWARES